MSNSLKKEGRQLTIDPHIIFDVIKSQSGALDKAMAELVMNSIDAGATRVDITFTDTGFKVSDNGKGFPSKEAILNWFEKFGTKHTEGDAKYGRFRMGRGQALSFASTVWHSGTHRMDVDIRNRGLDYDLHEVEVPVPGCVIEGNFYTPLSKMRSFGGEEMTRSQPRWEHLDRETMPSVSRLISALATMIMYVDVPVYVNDTQLNKDVKKQKWEFENKDAYMNLSTSAMESNELLFYNMGIFVCAIPSWRAGCSGTIVSKKAIKVNFARNAILTEECSVYQRIMDKVDLYVQESMIKGTIKNEQQRSYLARRLLNNQIPEKEGYQLKVFTDIRGRNVSCQDIANNWDIATMPEEDSNLSAAEFVQNSNKAFVFSRKNLERFEVLSFEHLILNLVNVLPDLRELEYFHFDEFEHEYEGFDKIIRDEDVTIKERIILEVLRKNQNPIKKSVQAVMEFGIDSRKILAGESDRGLAWTNGEDFIAFDRRTLKLADKGYAGFTQLCGILGHEYCHTESDLGSHQHPESFYELFHDAMYPVEVDKASKIGTTAFKMNRTYMELLLKNDLSIPSHVLRDIDEAKAAYGNYLVKDTNQGLAHLISQTKPISAERYFEISDWILTLNLEAEEITWLLLILRVAGKPEMYQEVLRRFHNNNEYYDEYWINRRLKKLISSGVFQELMSRLGVTVPKHIFSDPLAHEIKDDAFMVRYTNLTLIKEALEKKLELTGPTGEIPIMNPYKFQNACRDVYSLVNSLHYGHIELDENTQVPGLRDNEALIVLNRLILLTEIVKEKKLNKRFVTPARVGEFTNKGYVAKNLKDAYVVHNSLLRALAHTNIIKGKLDSLDLIEKTNLSQKEMRSLFKPVKHKINQI